MSYCLKSYFYKYFQLKALLPYSNIIPYVRNFSISQILRTLLQRSVFRIYVSSTISQY
jgi:hypothetical protein